MRIPKVGDIWIKADNMSWRSDGVVGAPVIVEDVSEVEVFYRYLNGRMLRHYGHAEHHRGRVSIEHFNENFYFQEE